MAEGFARAIAPDGYRIHSAGTNPGTVHPMTLEVMPGMGIDCSGHRSKSISDLGKVHFDLIITLCDSAKQSCPIFPGCPSVVHWSLKDPSACTGSQDEIRQAFRDSAETIKQLVTDLFQRGYLSALIQQKLNTDSMLNALADGVFAHDMDRVVFFFSTGAEKLTGLNSTDVLGRDCHDVFEPFLCGPECDFCDGCSMEDSLPREHMTSIVQGKGNRKELLIRKVLLHDNDGVVVGVAASITDRTRLLDLEHQLEYEEEFRGIVGQDHEMQRLYGLIRDLSQCDFPVAISGESGTGKELVARAIHEESPRSAGMFVPVNCGALPEGTLESELFGHVKGAFTGAIRDKKGRFDLAHGGTLFLDEVTEMAPSVQVKLLRVLQEGRFEPVGGEAEKRVDVRVISATNRNMKELVNKGDFREDLYYRLAVVPIVVPPLRDRSNDIPILTKRFLKEICETLGRPGMSVIPETMSILMSCPWPGNVRQLQNALQFAMIKCRDNTILPEHLPPEITASMPAAVTSTVPGKPGRKPKLAEDTVRTALTKTGGNKAKAARILGVGRATLYNFLRENPQMPADKGSS